MIPLLRRRWKVLLPVGVVGLVIAFYLFFIVFAVHLLFIDDEVNESIPSFDSGALMPIESSTTTTAPPDESVPEVSEPEVSVPETTLPIQIVRLVEGNFVDRSHPTAGTAVVLNDGTEQRFLRFEKFATDNGPDLNVYLSVAPVDAPAGQLDDDFVDLGDLKGNVGAQNYEIPTDVDLGHYSTVVIWCVRFSVAFGTAALATAT